MALPPNYLRDWLPQIGNQNAQGEYYLTDLIAIARKLATASMGTAYISK